MEKYQKWGLGISIVGVIAGIIVLVLILRYVRFIMMYKSATEKICKKISSTFIAGQVNIMKSLLVLVVPK